MVIIITTIKHPAPIVRDIPVYPGHTFHADLVAGHIVPDGTVVCLRDRVGVRSALDGGPKYEVRGYSYNGAGKLSYVLWKLKKDGTQAKRGIVFASADEFPMYAKHVANITFRNVG